MKSVYKKFLEEQLKEVEKDLEKCCKYAKEHPELKGHRGNCESLAHIRDMLKMRLSDYNDVGDTNNDD